MSIGPLGGLGASAAGLPVARNHGPEADRATQNARAGQQARDSDRAAQDAAGVGQPDGESHETDQRDPDGRRLWESTPRTIATPNDSDQDSDHQPTDTDDGRGDLLDLSG